MKNIDLNNEKAITSFSHEAHLLSPHISLISKQLDRSQCSKLHYEIIIETNGNETSKELLKRFLLECHCTAIECFPTAFLNDFNGLIAAEYSKND